MRALILILVALAPLLAGCGMLGVGDGGPPSTVPNVARERSVNPSEAVAIINAYRRSKGRGPLTVDPTLNRVAQETARELARRNQLRTEMHTGKGLANRLDRAGYPFSRAAENLGAGYPTLAMTVDGWKASRGHNKNLLIRNVTRAGIGLALTDQGKFKSYWVLILARPADGA